MKKFVLFIMVAGLIQSCTICGKSDELSMLEDRKLLQSNLEYLKEEKEKCNMFYFEWKEEYNYDSISAYFRGRPIPVKPKEVSLYQEEMDRIQREIMLNKKELDSIEIQLDYKYNYSF